MNVLLIAEDLYRQIGGGQTVYRKIIEATPKVHFYYLLNKESAGASRPANATGIPLEEPVDIRVLSDPPFSLLPKAALTEANRYARAVAGRSFDIVDVPDFLTVGGLLRAAFAHHGVAVKRFVLAMHGNISKSIELGWGSTGGNVADIRALERQQFKDVDAAYGISTRYIEEWRQQVDAPVHFVDPLHFIDRRAASTGVTGSAGSRPSLYCIGRTERRKGNDLFIELARWLDPTLYERAVQIGDEVLLEDGTSSLCILGEMAKHRQQEVAVSGSYNTAQLGELFAARSVVILPVRYDTLNLVALETIFSGCPLAVSKEAGACDYLDQNYPKLPYLKLDLQDLYGAVSQLEDLLRNYDMFRGRLNSALEEYGAVPVPPLDFEALYGTILAGKPNQIATQRKLVAYSAKKGKTPEEASSLAKKWKNGTARFFGCCEKMWAALWKAIDPGKLIARRIGDADWLVDGRFLDVLADSGNVFERLRLISQRSENSPESQREKLDFIYLQIKHHNPLFRCNYWLEIARLQRELGNELVAATYELRALRLMNDDPRGLLPKIERTLNQKGFPQVSEAVGISYGQKGAAGRTLGEFLQASYKRNLAKAEGSFAKTLDLRSGAPKVSIIVSLYKAASKLEHFLTCLSRQTLLREPGKVEFIFVDSGSPDVEFEVIEKFIAKTPLNLLYARSAGRETIQAAWNRGIHAAHGEYLVFLGADETIYPEALEILARELDENPQVDWAMGHSLVTKVDANGTLVCDVMPYDRTGAWKDIVYLETCYLSWVGGMYRKTIHDRFGFYDETFGAAGDTEFKNRLLPHLNVKFVPKMLGLFLDYPEERTTASSKAEIEDFRAWYVYRTPAGMKYVFDGRPIEEAERLFLQALGYRKSYCRHISSDIEMATYLAEYLVERSSRLVARETAVRLRKYLKRIQRLEHMNILMHRYQVYWAVIKLWAGTVKLQRYLHKTFTAYGATPAIQYFNDNRFEQHSGLWKTS